MAFFARKPVRRAVLYGLPFVALAIALLLRRETGLLPREGPLWDIGVPAFSIVLLIPTVLAALRYADAAADRLGQPRFLRARGARGRELQHRREARREVTRRALGT